MEQRANSEVSTFMEELEKIHLNQNDTGIIQISNIFLMPLFKIMWSMLVGEYTPEHDAVMAQMIRKSVLHTETGSFGPGLILVLPIIKYLLPHWTGFDVQMDFYKDGKRVATVRDSIILLHKLIWFSIEP
jgi:hypothetical protein